LANLAYALEAGLLSEGDSFGGSMREVVQHGTGFLSSEDLEAIATYIMNSTKEGC